MHGCEEREGGGVRESDSSSKVIGGKRERLTDDLGVNLGRRCYSGINRNYTSTVFGSDRGINILF